MVAVLKQVVMVEKDSQLKIKKKDLISPNLSSSRVKSIIQFLEVLRTTFGFIFEKCKGHDQDEKYLNTTEHIYIFHIYVII